MGLQPFLRVLAWGGLVLLVGLVFAARWLAEQVLEAPLEPLAIEAPLTLDVAPGTTALRLLADLERDGRLKEAWRMRLWLRWQGGGRHIEAGEYRVLPGATPMSLLDDLRHGRIVRHEIRLLEGWRFSQVRAALAANAVLVHDSAGLDDAAVMAALGVPGQSPEGLFFPDTYAFRRGEGELALLARAHARLQGQLAEAWAGRDPAVDEVLAGPYEALTLASIVEKETAAADERPLIAAVFLRRLAIGMRLQTDPTVIFGLGAAFDGDLRRSHLEADGPYNTYTRAGLPPTPIALVGRAALDAAVRPAAGKALYFVARGDGTHQFSESYREHLAAVREFQLAGGRRAAGAADSGATAAATASTVGEPRAGETGSRGTPGSDTGPAVTGADSP